MKKLPDNPENKEWLWVNRNGSVWIGSFFRNHEMRILFDSDLLHVYVWPGVRGETRVYIHRSLVEGGT